MRVHLPPVSRSARNALDESRSSSASACAKGAVSDAQQLRVGRRLSKTRRPAAPSACSRTGARSAVQRFCAATRTPVPASARQLPAHQPQKPGVAQHRLAPARKLEADQPASVTAQTLLKCLKVAPATAPGRPARHALVESVQHRPAVLHQPHDLRPPLQKHVQALSSSPAADVPARRAAVERRRIVLCDLRQAGSLQYSFRRTGSETLCIFSPPFPLHYELSTTPQAESANMEGGGEDGRSFGAEACDDRRDDPGERVAVHGLGELAAAVIIHLVGWGWCSVAGAPS